VAACDAPGGPRRRRSEVMSTFIEHVHRDTDTVPLLPSATTGRGAVIGRGAEYGPAKNGADTEALLDADPTGNEAQNLVD
jgi:hypothetical protein